MNAESQRLEQARNPETPWKKWGPYLSERQWGTVREDYSESGNAWDYFSHDQARSRAYHWGEDGLAGISDDRQRLCLALALWNGNDPILKERLFGLTNSEGNHGEDVKEYYFYLDSTPTHSYLKYLYKYPQAAYPYDEIVRRNRERGRKDLEYELIDTGVFNDDRYFDVFVEYAKESPEDILVEITIHNRGPEAAELHVLPTLWFRNRWSWGVDNPRPVLKTVRGKASVVKATEELLGDRYLYCDGDTSLLFTENETNAKRLFGGQNRTPYVKDGIHACVVRGETAAVNPKQTGTKVAAHYHVNVAAGQCEVLRLRLSPVAPAALDKTYGKAQGAFGAHFDEIMQARRQEADAFYAEVIPNSLDADAANVMRQALAGMMWSKQYFYFDVNRWLDERGCSVYKPSAKQAPRNAQWHHMYNADVISMPDKWEYPWYAAWDLAFHVLPLTLVDPDFGKQQLSLMLRDTYLHPNGQIPAYEWNFGDVNPPVHPWATIFTYRLEKVRTGKGDVEWLERSFQRLLLNFTWWLNRKDRSGKNTFEGGFLGLDNIGVFDRSAPLPTGGYLEQADGTAWMALYSLNMLEIAIELALHNETYAEMASKFVAHFVSIASATIHAGGDTGMWDEEDGFFYDVLRLPDGTAQRLKVRSMVGLLPLCAVAVFEGEFREKYPEVMIRLKNFIEARPELIDFIHDPTKLGADDRRLGAILDETKLRRVLARVLDENEFLSPYGIRSLSRFHADHPYKFNVGGQEFSVPYLPAESDTGMFGGNSNWRGPIWMPVNALIVRALLQYYTYYGNDFTIECPTGSGRLMNLYQVAEEISRRLASMFVKDENGRRPFNGATEKFRSDPHWCDLIQFYEYFHGDNGAGLGASHQTGWTGVIARMMHLFATSSAEQMLKLGKAAAFIEEDKVPKARKKAASVRTRRE
ncbi:MGH1-like glycoside hydrolase domain-containing protein [Propionivibrio limicola]|uniref:MGH1-like glycoside hydrolase domain-containing protein n=1 Tax=Propionivibrio limicola TaxID=167645 RepID=UPI0012919795|nr:glucosidase [Propionivibrio limicola]